MDCPSCGKANRDEARFCDGCGASLDVVEAPLAPEDAALTPGVDLPEALGGGRYAVKRYLGAGGRKRVYLADDREADREVAVAVFDTEGMAETVRTRARREAQAMGKLGAHPHIVTVLDAGEESGRPYIVSEYMPGGDVAELLDAAPGRRLEVVRALELATDICLGLEHAHGRGIVHRDLKPANVWLDGAGSARIGDFGLAATGAGSRQAGDGMLVGTVAYLPPEQALGKPSDPRSDIYSLGVLIYEMLVGNPPFAGDDAVAIISQHLNSEPLPPSRGNPAVPPALDRLVASMLGKKAGDRPAAAAEVRAELEAIAAGGMDPEPEQPQHNPLDSLAGGIFVGRESELEVLRSSVDDALDGRGGLLLLLGEPGIGKTRTSEEIATYAQVRGARVYWGRCHEGEGAPAYWPWSEAIRAYVRDSDPVGLAWEVGSAKAEIAQIVPEITEQLGPVEPPDHGDAATARFRLFDAVTSFLTGAARTRPLVLVLDDLHWADESSLLLLKFCASALGDSGLLILATYRDVELGRHHPLAKILGELGGGDHTSRVALRGLEAAAIARYIEMTTGSPPQEGLADAVHDRTEGNPFFVAEVVRLLAEDGTLTAGANWAGSIPEGVREAVGRRLDRLPASVNGILTLGAAIGREFDLEVLDDLCSENATELRELLAQAVESQVISEGVNANGGLRWSFSHALIRETLYAELSGAKRLEVHRRIGASLERVYGDAIEANVAELAHHFIEAAPGGDADRAIDYAIQAGRRAVAQVAHEDAVHQFRRALETMSLLPEADPVANLALRLELGEAQTRAGRFSDAKQSFTAAAGVARDLADGDSLARAALGVSALSETGSYDSEIAALVTEALEAIGPADSGTRSLLLSALSQEEYWIDPQGTARPRAEEALEVARRAGDLSAQARALASRQFLLVTCAGGVDERLANAAELVTVGEAAGDRDAVIRAHAYRVTGHLENGEVGAADRAFDEYARLANEMREPRHLWHVPMIRAGRAIMDGRFDEAERLSREGARMGERAEEPLAAQFSAIQLSIVRSFQGRAEEMLPLVRAMVERYPAVPVWRMALISFLVDADRGEEAEVEYERLMRAGLDQIPLDSQWIIGMGRIGETAFHLGDAERAKEIAARLEPFADEVMVVGRAVASNGPVARTLGMLALARGRVDEAVSRLERGVELSAAMGDRPIGADGSLWLAKALLKRGGAGDRERAVDLLGEVIEDAQEMGMRTLLERAVALRLQGQGVSVLDVTTSIDSVISAVSDEKPDIAAHVGADGRVAIVFSDIENSTLMTERLGDRRWIEVLRAHNAIFRERVARNRGFEVKNQGDGFMLVFPDASSALAATTGIQRDFAEADSDQTEGIRVRMGIHVGEAIQEEGDFFGRTVILAARIAAQANGGEILVSDEVSAAAMDDGECPEFRDERLLELKGLAGSHRVLAVAWDSTSVAV